MSFTIASSVNGGWYDRDKHAIREEMEKQIEAAKKSAENWAARIEREKAAGQISKEALDGFDAAHTKYKQLKEALDSGAVFVNEGITYTGHMTTEPDFSIAEHCGRFYVKTSRYGFTVDAYHDTDTAETVAEGAAGTPKVLTDYMARVMTNSEDRVKFEDILGVGEMIKDDDPLAVKVAFESTHGKHITNAENKAILVKLTGAKDAVAVDPQALETVINANLCGKAKRGAEIWTNKAGFAALDQLATVGGYPLIKRNAAGDMVYREKYVVREFPDEIMPSTDAGAPVLIGDFKNIVRFAVDDPRYLAKLDLYDAIAYDRLISYEIPVLTTTSDEAYINGYIAKA